MTLSVLMFCPQFRPKVGGAERQAEKLSKALSKKGVRVTVLTPQFVRESPMYEEDAGVSIYRFPLFDLSKRFSWIRGLGPLNLPIIRAQVIGALLEHIDNVDVLHAHIASPMSAFAMQAAKRRQVPAVCTVATAGIKSDFGNMIAIGTIGIGGRLLVKAMIKKLDHWVAISQAVVVSLTEWGVPIQRITKIPNGVDLPTLDNYSGRAHSVKRFLYLGRMARTAERDVPTLIRAFDRLASHSSDVELALVGGGDLYQETVDLVSQCRNYNRIHMPGFQTPDPWLRWADCFVLPSRYEGLSNALLEAMSYGLACIANDIPPNREALDNGRSGVLVPVGDEIKLYETIFLMSNDAEFADAMRKAALGRVRSHYDIGAVATRHVDLYESLLSKKM